MSFLLMQNLQVVIRNLTYNSISFNKSLIGETRNLVHIIFVWSLNRNTLTFMIPQKLVLVMNVLCLILYFLLWPSIFSNSLNLRIMSFSYNSSKRSCKDEDEKSIYRLITFYSQGIYIGSTPLFNLMRCLRTLSEI